MEMEGVEPEGAPEPEVAQCPLTPLGQLTEMLVFLALIVPSSVLASFAYQQQRASFALVAWATMARDLALTALVVFFIWRNRESLRSLGWQFRPLDVLLGLVLYGPFILVVGLFETVFHGIGLRAPTGPPPFLMPRGTADLVLASLLAIIVAIAEETMFRGYLLLRLRGIGAGIVTALLISSAIFAAGHGYEGSAGVATVGVMGLIFALIYLWRRNLAAPITMHFLQDFLGLVVLPLATRHHLT